MLYLEKICSFIIVKIVLNLDNFIIINTLDMITNIIAIII